MCAGLTGVFAQSAELHGSDEEQKAEREDKASARHQHHDARKVVRMRRATFRIRRIRLRATAHARIEVAVSAANSTSFSHVFNL